MYTNTMITYNNVLIQYRYRCISITYMIKNFRTSKRTVWRIEFRVVQNFDVVSNKALISDETDSTIHIYPPPISILFLLPSYRFETRMFETNWNDSNLLRHLPYVVSSFDVEQTDTEETVIQKVSKYMKNIAIGYNLIIIITTIIKQ